MKLSMLAGFVFGAVITVGIITWNEGRKTSGFHEKKVAELKTAYRIEETANPREIIEREKIIDTVIAIPQKINNSEIMVVKIKHQDKGGSGYVTALTATKDLHVGERVLVRRIEFKSNVNKWTALIADHLPSEL